MAVFTGDAIGVDQRLLLNHLHVLCDRRVGGELLLRVPLLVEKAEVVPLVSLRLPE